MKLIKYWSIFALVLLGMFACKDDEIEIVSKISFEKTSVSVSEKDGKLIVPLSITSPLTEASTVWISIVEGSEVGGKEMLNYRVPASIWLGKDAVRGSYEITIIDDPYPNENRTFEIEITDVWGGAIQDDVSQRCTITIEDDDSKENVTVGFQDTSVDVNEDIGIYELPVVLEGLLSDSVLFKVKTENGTAIEGVHFELLETKQKINQGEKWAVIPIKILDKQATEEDRSFNIIIEEAQGATPQDTTVSISKVNHTCKVTINKIIRQVRFPELEMIVDEMTKAFEYPVALTAPVPHDVKVRLVARPNSTAKAGVHYEIDKTELIIKKGETEASAIIKPIDDKLGNPHRFVDFDIEIITDGVELSEEFKSSRLIIENDDTSIGFVSDDEFIWMYSTATIPVKLAGVRGGRYLVEVKAKADAEVQENIHYMILTKSIEIGENDSVVYVKIATLNSDLPSFDLPLEIASVKSLTLGFNGIIDQGNRDLTLKVLASPKSLDRSNWSIEFSSTHQAPDGGAEKIIDGDEDTNWHTEWQGGNPDGPHIIIIDMQDEQSIGEVAIVLSRYTKTIKVEIGDNETWSSMGTMTFSQTAKERVTLKSPDVFSGRYMRLSVMGRGPNGDTATIQEVYASGNIK